MQIFFGVVIEALNNINSEDTESFNFLLSHWDLETAPLEGGLSIDLQTKIWVGFKCFEVLPECAFSFQMHLLNMVSPH